MASKMGKVRVVDYIADKIAELGVKDIFTLTGGGAMFLNDCVAKHPDLKAICNHHEQASAMGAVGYAKYTNGYGVTMVTTGCGSTNAITGLLEAWQDNVSCVFLSGQVNKSQTTYGLNIGLRQLGVQEANIVDVVRPICKYAVMITDPNRIPFQVEKAFYLAKRGRPGPVWLDIPLDVQGAYIDPDKCLHYQPYDAWVKKEVTQDESKTLTEMFDKSKRPVLLVGNGVRLSDATEELKSFVEKYNIPTVATFLGVDLLESDHPLMIGRVGIKGGRAANFALQNSDLLITVGTRLGVPVTGYNYETFAREAEIVVVDIDTEEHRKKTVKIDKFVQADAKEFFNTIEFNRPSSDSWSDTCLGWKQKWRVCNPEWDQNKEGIDLYYFTDKLSKANKKDSVVVSDAGSAYYVPSQFLDIKDQQRYVTSGAQADMGFTIPAAIGVSVAKGYGEVVGITGDGSFQTNIQELQTIKHYNLPIKLFVWNNHGYLSIRTTQRKFFDGRFIGVDGDSGVSLPDIQKITEAYGLKYTKIETVEDLEGGIQEVLDYEGPVVCEVMCQKWQEVVPTLISTKTKDGRIVSRPFEDMYPLLTREEFYDNMIIDPINYEE
jgi:acetolactate synthase-1/2/3 large subunit